MSYSTTNDDTILQPKAQYSFSEEQMAFLTLSFIDGVGPKLTRALYTALGSGENIINASLKTLRGIENIGEIRARAIKNAIPDAKARAGKEEILLHKIGGKLLLMGSDQYPKRLNACADGPTLLYYLGNANLNALKVVSVIGTRKNTDYGQRITEELIEGLNSLKDILVVSGLAHGIDAIAHKKCVQLGIPTLGVLGTGLDIIYPFYHKSLGADMLRNGGLLTEFPIGTKPERTNFPVRNRIVAGMADVTVIVESDVKGGAMITAYLANGYGREVAVFPGRTTDIRSAGCNHLIKTNNATLITQTEDLLELMNWDVTNKNKTVQPRLLLELTEQEQRIVNTLAGKENLHSDELLHASGLSIGELAAVLLNLEMQGVIKTMAGKQYKLV